MTFNDVQTLLNEWDVEAPDVCRATLYLRELEATRTFVNQTLRNAVNNGGLGPGYDFVSRAITSSELLTQLAKTLDYFVGAGVRTALMHNCAANNWHYRDYFDHLIFDANQVQFDANIDQFYLTYPVSEHAVHQAAVNFRNNIREACIHIYADRNRIRDFFGPLHNGLQLNHLLSIKSSGSDFHKGGKQVLILKFDVNKNTNDLFSTHTTLKLIYKPGDVEIDCLLTGNSAATQVIPNFNLQSSLVELINARVRQIRAQNPFSDLEELPTYYILPQAYHSTVNGPPPYNQLQNMYGYIEYLNNDVSPGINLFGNYPFASGDYLLQGDETDQAIIDSFYRMMGEWIAICSTFSITDMHMENVRVRQLKPYLIDLELSLLMPIEHVAQTTLIDNTAKSGILGVRNISGREFWIIVRENIRGQTRLERDNHTEWSQNRLWRKIGGVKRLIEPDLNRINEGLQQMLELIGGVFAAPNNAIQAWVTRASNVLVRYVTFETGYMRGLRNTIFVSMPLQPNQAAAAAITAERTRYFETQYQVYIDNQNQFNYNPQLPPDFLSLSAADSGADLTNLDVPSFYHKAGQAGLVNSRGADIPVPANVTINNVQVPFAIGRGTFFNGARIPAVVNAQLNYLTNPNNVQLRYQALSAEVEGFLPDDPDPVEHPLNFKLE